MLLFLPSISTFSNTFPFPLTSLRSSNLLMGVSVNLSAKLLALLPLPSLKMLGFVRTAARPRPPDPCRCHRGIRSSLLGGRQVVGGAESTPVQIGLKRLEDGSFPTLAGRGVDPGSMFEFYRQRWDILASFAALKSRGFDLETTHLTEPDRIRKLLDVLALTCSWTRIGGLDRKNREGPPRECANGNTRVSL